VAPTVRREDSSNAGREGARDRTAIFVLNGEYWTVGYGGATFLLKASKGLAYIHRLLRHPNEEFHVLDLLSGSGTNFIPESADTSSTDSSLTVGRLGDAGEMLDSKAKQDYKRRLFELRESLEDARGVGNSERAAEFESEIDFLTREISRAVGLGGRDRRAGSAAERARLNVTRAIKAAMLKISEWDASLGTLLDGRIKTGLFCSYSADPRALMNWQFTLGTETSGQQISLAEPQASEPLPTRGESSFLRAFTEGTTFVGRETEREILTRALEEALNGQGKIVLIGGAAGVGKTRIGSEIAAEALRRGMRTFVGSCYDRDDPVPFIPFVEILEETLAQTRDMAAFREMLGKDAPEIGRLLPQLRRLFPDIPRPLDLPTEQSRRILFAATSDFFARVARNRPMVILLDDLHWADEGTLQLLNHLAQLVPGIPMLIVGTYRDFEVEAGGQLAATLDELIRRHLVERMTLGGLSKSAVAEMLSALGGRTPPETAVQVFYSHTEGNPFFIEELFLHLVERGKLTDANGDFRGALAIADIDVPQSVRLVIGRRLARLSDGTQKVLGTAAVIGRSFTFELLEASTATGADALLDCIDEAERGGLIASSLQYPEVRFKFAHELIRRAVLDGQSAPRRQRLHLDIADAIERRYPRALEDHAEDLAHHLWQAGSAAEAARTIRCLAKAANQAITRSAGLEAIAYLSKGLDRLRSLPETPQRDEQELELQVRLGMTLTFAKGYSSLEVQPAYARARELCQQVGDSPQLFRILRGLAGYYSVRADHKTAFQLAEQCLSLSERLNDPLLLLGSHMELGATSFCLGNYAVARTHLEKAIALHEPQAHRIHSSFHGQDFGASARARISHVLWFLGYPDQALSRNQEALALARELAHPFTLAYVNVFAAVLNQFCRNPRAVQEYAEAAIQLANHQGFPLWAVAGKILCGWALSEQGHSEGIAQMTEGLASWGSVGTENTYTHQPYFLALLAEAHGKFGQVEQGLELLVQMSAVVERTRERFYEAELYRLKGELLLKSAAPVSKSANEEAESCLRQAMAIARRQNTKSMELRAATTLSRLWRGKGKVDEARKLLSEVYGWFTEGFDSSDLKQAKALLDKMC